MRNSLQTTVAAVLLGAAATLSAASANAAESMFAPATDNPSGAYIGGGWGRFNLDIRSLDDVSSGVNSIAHSHDDAWKLFAGYRFNPYIGLGAEYLDFGDSTEHFTATGSNGNYRVRLKGFSPYLEGTLPLGPVELFARAGYYFYDNDVHVNFDSPGPGQSAGVDSSHSRSDFIYGGGLGLNLWSHLNLRAEYETVNVHNASNSDALWLTAAYRF